MAYLKISNFRLQNAAYSIQYKLTNNITHSSNTDPKSGILKQRFISKVAKWMTKG